MKKVLVKFTHGLGDAVQLTCVLKHLAEYRSDWEVDVEALYGKHTAARGLCRRHFTMGSGYDRTYDQVFDLGWYENYNRYHDCQNSKVTNCLREEFGIQPDHGLMNYTVKPSPGDVAATEAYFRKIGARELSPGKFGVVVAHHKGNTSSDKKNLECADLLETAAECRAAGWLFVLLDWDKRTHPDLLSQPGVVLCSGDTAPSLWKWEGTGDAGRLAALINAASWFVGIDSGPGHVAGATSTPSVVVWTGHHPVQFYDLCPNVLHLVPHDHAQMPPCDDPAILQFFKSHYRYKEYQRGPCGVELAGLCRQILGQPSGGPKRSMRRSGFWVPERADWSHQAWTIIQDVYVRDAYRTNLRPKKDGVEYVVDIGANIGTFSRLWAERNPNARIAAVEVHPDLIPYLKANLRPEDVIINAACGYHTEPLYLLDSINSDKPLSVGGSRVVLRPEWEAESDPQYVRRSEPLPTVTLEQVMQKAGFPWIDVLKLDCENSELDILSNCDLGKVRTILVESHDPEAWRELLASKFSDWDVGHHVRSRCGRFETWHVVRAVAE